MSSPNQLSLLRRTLAAIAAATLAFTVTDALSQGRVKLTGGSKNDECSYSSMSITPDGGVNVQCSGTTQPPVTTETFAMNIAALTSAPLTSPLVSVMRSGSGSTFAATTVFITYSGTGCVLNGNTYPLGFNAGQMAFQFEAPLAFSGTCTIRLGAPPSPAVLGNPNTTTITVGTPGPTPPTVPAGCPAVPQNLLTATFAGSGNPILQMQASGQVVAIPLPGMSSSGQVSFGESAGGAYTPQPVTLEVSIGKCPGYVDTDYTNRCNIRSTNGNYNSITWLVKTYQGRGGTIDANTAGANGLCWAGDSSSQYYINARWSYASCAFGAQVCGFSIVYNLGGY